MTEQLREIIARLRNYTTSELCDGVVDYHTMDYHIRRQVTKKKSSVLHLRSIPRKESAELFPMRF